MIIDKYPVRLGRYSIFVRAMRRPYKFFLSIASGGNGIPWTTNGEQFRIDPEGAG
ncbi:MAG: hypothetical protein ABJC63_00130 [Gemmatimonadales bacterium]